MNLKNTLREQFAKARSSLKEVRVKDRNILIAFVLSGFIALYWDAKVKPEPDAKTPEPVESAATLIPRGYVLVPIEVSNYDSLDSILGKYGVVDLYLPSENSKLRQRKVAERVRILRAPLNPSRFAVLVKETESSRLVSYSGPFTVIVQNSNISGTGLVSSAVDSANGKPTRSKTRVTVEGIGHAEIDAIQN